jgi:hypothetical protein
LTLFYNHISTSTTGTNQLLDQIIMTLDHKLKIYINVYDNSLSRKWLTALNDLLINNYHLEKNYCWVGFADSPRNGEYLLNQINASIAHINSAELGYIISDHYSIENSVTATGGVDHTHFNQLHKYFEDLQGVASAISPYYTCATPETRWHIRQLNLLCHEFESWQLSWRKKHTAPEWQRPSQLMCWLNAPRFELTKEDYELFGIDTINRSLGGVYVGVNKAIGKHHWEVFHDEGRDSRISELTTTTLRAQTLAAGDFDIEWAQNPAGYDFQRTQLADFARWLTANGFDPEDPSLTIGHPQVGQVDLQRSFGTNDLQQIWAQLADHMDVYKITTDTAQATYTYNWSDSDYAQQQIAILEKQHAMDS